MTTGNAAGFANGSAVIPQHAWLRILPADRQRFVHLHILTGLDAATTQNALAWVVAIKWIGRIDRVRFLLEWDRLVFDREQLGSVVDGAIAVVVVTNRAVEQVIAQDAVEGLPLRGDYVPG